MSGDLLQRDWPTFYSFEPLITMRNRNPRNDKSHLEDAIDLLNDLFDCDFANLSLEYLSPVYWKVPYLNWNQAMSRTVADQDMLYFNASLNQFVCHRCRNRLIKSIRFGVEDFVLLQHKRNRSKASLFVAFIAFCIETEYSVKCSPTERMMCSLLHIILVKYLSQTICYYSENLWLLNWIGEQRIIRTKPMNNWSIIFSIQ